MYENLAQAAKGIQHSNGERICSSSSIRENYIVYPIKLGGGGHNCATSTAPAMQLCNTFVKSVYVVVTTEDFFVQSCHELLLGIRGL